jgi:hypothetical protein
MGRDVLVGHERLAHFLLLDRSVIPARGHVRRLRVGSRPRPGGFEPSRSGSKTHRPMVEEAAHKRSGRLGRRETSCVLREAKNAGFVPQGMWFWKRYVFHAGKHRAASGLKSEVWSEARERQQTQAVRVLHGDGRQYWWCRHRFYWEDDDLCAADVYALVYERERRKDRQLKRARAVLSMDSLRPTQRREASRGRFAPQCSSVTAARASSAARNSTSSTTTSFRWYAAEPTRSPTCRSSAHRATSRKARRSRDPAALRRVCADCITLPLPLGDRAY